LVEKLLSQFFNSPRARYWNAVIIF